MLSHLRLILLIIIVIAPVACKETAYVYTEDGGYELEDMNLTAHGKSEAIAYTVSLGVDGTTQPKTKSTSTDKIKQDISRKVNKLNRDVIKEGSRWSGNISGDKRIDQICSIYDYLVSNWVYRADWTNLEYFQYSNESLEYGKDVGVGGKGDCDDFSILLAALVESVGGTPRIIFAYGPQGGHAYAQVYIGQDSGFDGKVSRMIDWLKSKYGVREIYTIRDDETNDIWLNLDWWKDPLTKKDVVKHPGGPFFNASDFILAYYDSNRGNWTSLTAVPEPPIAKFSVSKDNPNSLENVTFDASESKDLDTEIKAWNWDFGDGGKGEGKTAIHSYHQGGSFTVTLTVTDNDDVEKSSKHTKAIEVNGLPIPVIDYTPIDPQLDDAIDFDASQSRDPDPLGSIKSYYWEFDDGETSTRSHPSPHKYESNGSYVVSLTVEDDKGAAAKTSVILKVNLQPSANFIITPHEKERYNVGEGIIFDASSSYDLDGIIKNWSWDFDDIAAPEEGEIVEHSFSSGGNHTVKLIVQDINNATDEYSKIIYINSLPVPVIYMQRDGTFVKFSGLDSYDQEGGPLKYRWDFENDGIDDSGLPNPDKQYLSKANYTVRLTVIDENGASNSTIMDIFIEEINQAPVLESLSADMSSPQQAGTAVTWTASATDPENDPLVYRFLLNGLLATDWMSSSIWTWFTSESMDVGSNLVEVQVRDGNHAGSDSYDSSVSSEFTITSIGGIVYRMDNNGNIPEGIPSETTYGPNISGTGFLGGV